MDLPQGYTLQKRGTVSLLTLDRAGIDSRDGGLFESRDPLRWKGAAGTLPGGRAGLVRIRLDDGRHMLVKPLHRGGWIGRFNRCLHFSNRRIFQEASLCSYLLGRDIPVAPVFLGRAETCGPGLYRLHLGTLEIANEGTLFDLIERDDIRETRADAVMRAAGRSIRRLHDAGVHHPDLNLGNLIVLSTSESREPPGICIIDLDRAFRQERLDHGPRCANLARLYRHAAKNGLDGKSRFPNLWRNFLAGYSMDAEEAVRFEEDVDRHFRRRRLLHRLSWALQGRP